MRIYYDTITTRMDLLRSKITGYMPSLSDLHALVAAAAELDDKDPGVKPIKRDDANPLSLFLLDGVPSVKLGILGRGVSARTYLHADGLPGKDEDHYYAVKVFSYDDDSDHEKPISIPSTVKREIDVLKRLNRFIRYDVRRTPKGKIKYYVVEKFIEGTTLQNALNNLGDIQSLNMEHALNLMIKLCNSLKKFHATGYAHGDFKTDNIMVGKKLNDNPETTLIDFNWASLPNEIRTFQTEVYTNTHEQYPPECCGKRTVYLTPQADIYALGAVFNRILDKTKYATGVIERCDVLISQMRTRTASQRPSLDKITQELGVVSRILMGNPKRQMSAYEFQPEKNKSFLEKKKNVLLALGEYVSGIRPFRVYWSEEGYTAKAELFNNLIQDLQKCCSRSFFYEKLKDGIVDYVFRFVVSDLKHYVDDCNDLGAGLGCFIKAVKVLGDDFELNQLMNEVTHAVPRLNNYKHQFIATFRRLVGLTDNQIVSYGKFKND